MNQTHFTLIVAWNYALIGWEGIMLSMDSSHALTGEGNHHLTEWEGIMMSLRKGIMFPLSGRESSFYMLSLHCKESCSCWVGVNNATA